MSWREGETKFEREMSQEQRYLYTKLSQRSQKALEENRGVHVKDHVIYSLTP